MEKRKRSSGVLHVFAAFFLILTTSEYSKSLYYQNLTSVLPFYAASVIFIVYGFFRKQFDRQAKFNHWIRLLQFLSFSLLGLLMSSRVSVVTIVFLFLWSAVTLILMFIERKVFHDTELEIKNEGISVPAYFTHHLIPWHVISDFKLRPDFVTIFRNNQTYVQLELLKKIDYGEIRNINDFCRERILENAHADKK
ncbi:MAG: hypothetical protein ICV66_07385 [Chitinophagaceae bacterium]|nr:hypothetical protein [Chitinophagaceae bacterium]